MHFPHRGGRTYRSGGRRRSPLPAYPIGAPRSQLRVVGVASHSLELATDPAAEVLIAYEMNSEPLAPITGRRSV